MVVIKLSNLFQTCNSLLTLKFHNFFLPDNYNVPRQPVWPGVEVQLLHIQDPKLQPKTSANFLKAIPKFFANGVLQTVTNNPSYLEFVIATGYAPVVTPKPSQNSTSNALENRLDFFESMTKEMAISRYFMGNSFFVKKHFRAEELNEVQSVVSEIPKNTNGIMITSEQGAVAKRQIKDSAYVHRDSLYNVRLFFESMTIDGVADGKKWRNKFLKSTKFMDSGETYQNYPDLELKDYLSRYYGSNLDKLIQIKRKWDPKGYFNSKMSIPTTWRHEHGDVEAHDEKFIFE